MTISEMNQAETLDWGSLSYRLAWERQNERLSSRIQGRCADALIFVEHPPVYTIGVRRGAGKHLLLSPAGLESRGIEVVETNRGGDITFHGPGQIVGYPIVSLESRRDLHAYLRLLEQVLINTAGYLGLAAGRREGMTGIWMADRKIAAIGVAVKRWVTSHGFALNVNNDLSPFAGIVPCGITDASVTSLATELGHPLDMQEVKRILADEFWKQFGEFVQHRNG